MDCYLWVDCGGCYIVWFDLLLGWGVGVGMLCLIIFCGYL